MGKSRINSLNWSFLKITILPMLLLGVIITVAGSFFVANSLSKNSEENMVDLSSTFLLTLDELYPGDFTYEEKTDGLYMYKGDHMINMDFKFIDEMKAQTGADITIFCNQYAVVTTMTDNDNTRLIGAGASDVIKTEIIDQFKSKMYTNVDFYGTKYYAYYRPLYNNDGSVIGMLSITEPMSYTNRLVWNAIVPILLCALGALVVVCFFTREFSKKFIKRISDVQKYMKTISQGDFKAEISLDVSSADDELGDMGKSAMKMAASLRRMVEEDQLTNLLNRRSAYKHLVATFTEYYEKGVKFCIAMGDIDFFKKVNDTYGHEAGDQVLIAVATTMKNFMVGKGYAIRWGGEEFILIFDGYTLERAAGMLEDLLNEVRALEVVSGENTIKVTMSYGIHECNEDEMAEYAAIDSGENNEIDTNAYVMHKIDSYINEADARLYYAKANGRNQIIDHAVNEITE